MVVAICGAIVAIISCIVGVWKYFGRVKSEKRRIADEAKKQSYLFDGILDTSREGLPVPVVYGRLLVQGITINSEIDTNDTDGTGTGYDKCTNSDPANNIGDANSGGSE